MVHFIDVAHKGIGYKIVVDHPTGERIRFFKKKWIGELPESSNIDDLITITKAAQCKDLLCISTKSCGNTSADEKDGMLISKSEGTQGAITREDFVKIINVYKEGQEIVVEYLGRRDEKPSSESLTHFQCSHLNSPTPWRWRAHCHQAQPIIELLENHYPTVGTEYISFGSEALGKAVVNTFVKRHLRGDVATCILPYHGTITFGRSPQELQKNVDLLHLWATMYANRLGIRINEARLLAQIG